MDQTGQPITSLRSPVVTAEDAARRRRWLAAIGALTALAAALRFATLDRQSFWSDEAITVLLSRMDLGAMLHTVADTESTPPVYYVLVWAWAKVAGDGEIGLRSLSALAGVASVPVTALAGLWLAGRRAGVVAAALVAVSPPLVWYSQEARSYALLVLLCGVSFAAFVRALAAPRVGSLATWAAASTLAVGTHYFAVFVVGAEAILLLSRRGRGVWWAVAVVTAGSAAFLPLALEQRGNGFAEYVSSAGDGLGERIVVAVKQLLVGASLPADRAVAAVVGLLLAASVVLLATAGARRERRAALVAATVGGAAIVVPVSLAAIGLDYLNTRNALAGFVPLAVAASVGLTLSTRRRHQALVPLAAVATMAAVTVVVAADPTYHRPDWRGFARALGEPDVARALIVAPDHQGWFARVPLQIYVPQARAVDDALVPAEPQFAGVSRRPEDHATPPQVMVQEVVLAGVGWAVPEPPQTLPSQLRLVEERSSDGFRYRRYRSSTPVAIPTSSLVVDRAAVLVERRG